MCPKMIITFSLENTIYDATGNRYFKPILLKLYLLQRIKHKIIYCGLDAITLNMPYTIIVLV